MNETYGLYAKENVLIPRQTTDTTAQSNHTYSFQRIYYDEKIYINKYIGSPLLQMTNYWYLGLGRQSKRFSIGMKLYDRLMHHFMTNVHYKADSTCAGRGALMVEAL